MSTEKMNERFHRESVEGVDAVLRRMIRSLGLDEGFGYAEALDISRDTVKTWRRRGQVPMRFLTGFAKEHGLSLDYLRFGGKVQHEPSDSLTQGFSESAVHQAVIDAVDLLSLDKKVDAQQLAKAVVKLCQRAAPVATSASTNTQQVNDGVGQQFNAPVNSMIQGDIINKGRKK